MTSNSQLSFEFCRYDDRRGGIPVTIARSYDTLRSNRDGDFGLGWRLEFREADLRTSLPNSGLEDLGLYTPFKVGTRVFVTLPGSERKGFTFTPEIRPLPGFGQDNNLVLAVPHFTPDPGVKTKTVGVLRSTHG